MYFDTLWLVIYESIINFFIADFGLLISDYFYFTSFFWQLIHHLKSANEPPPCGINSGELGEANPKLTLFLDNNFNLKLMLYDLSCNQVI